VNKRTIFLFFLKHTLNQIPKLFAVKLRDWCKITFDYLYCKPMNGISFKGSLLVAHFVKNAPKCPHISKFYRIYDLKE
jgi:hypothetical protein